MTTPIAAGLVDADVRAQFESWITAPPFEKTIERHSENGSWPGNYRDYGVQLAWCAWEDSAKSERERICTAIKAEDDHCADGDYMMDSDDCIKVARGTWERPDWNGANA